MCFCKICKRYFTIIYVGPSHKIPIIYVEVICTWKIAKQYECFRKILQYRFWCLTFKCFGYLWASRYGVVIVHTEPTAHAISEYSDDVPLAENNRALTDYLSSSGATVEPEETNYAHYLFLFPWVIRMMQSVTPYL